MRRIVGYKLDIPTLANPLILLDPLVGMVSAIGSCVLNNELENLMKYMKRSNKYVAANTSFYPASIEAYSYGWWKFVGVIDGLVVFNDYRYSVTTSGHQRKVASLMSELGIKIDLTLSVPDGLPGTYMRYGQVHPLKTLQDVILAAEENLCREFLENELKREERNEKARVRRAEKRAKLDAEFKANVDSISIADIEAHRAAKQEGA
jgi:hypothetical protein